MEPTSFVTLPHRDLLHFGEGITPQIRERKLNLLRDVITDAITSDSSEAQAVLFALSSYNMLLLPGKFRWLDNDFEGLSWIKFPNQGRTLNRNRREQYIAGLHQGITSYLLGEPEGSQNFETQVWNIDDFKVLGLTPSLGDLEKYPIQVISVPIGANYTLIVLRQDLRGDDGYVSTVRSAIRRNADADVSVGKEYYASVLRPQYQAERQQEIEEKQNRRKQQV